MSPDLNTSVINDATLGLLSAQKKETIKPVYVGNIHDDVDTWGGKAVSLWRLRRASFKVPEAWVIPCSACATRPLVATYNIRDYFYSYWGSLNNIKFAVRSGAPVSMPGLLNTKLNVKFEALNEAIEAVWDSWHSDHAKLYRQAKGLSDDMGTAVIIQMMPPNIKYAGVAFSNSPTNIDDPDEFSPVVEYVSGLGDKLVGGEVTPERAEEGSDVYQAVYSLLNKIHNKWGPSDTEFVIDTDFRVHWVQQRALKFTAPPAEDLVDESGRELLAKGKAIGATAKLTAKVVMCQTGVAPEPGAAIYVQDFLPEYYPLMMKAPAILTGVGGETCHAAIIARELGKPAISNIKYDKASILNGQKVYLDGATGKIFKAKDEDEVAAVQAVETVATLEETRTPDLSIAGLGIRWDVNHLLYRFYKTLDNHAQGICSTEHKDKVVTEIARLFATYFYIATCCEMRYMRRRGSPSKQRRLVLAVLKRLGFEAPMIESDLPHRVTFATRIVQPPNLKFATLMMEWVTRGYDNVNWIGSYGGKKWGSISGLLLRYLKGELNNTMFVDAAFNLKHNGGFAFDKFSWIACCQSTLSYQLNAKQKVNGIKQLTIITSTYCGVSASWLEDKVMKPGSIMPVEYKHFLEKSDVPEESAQEVAAVNGCDTSANTAA